jgi:hypothetical protein
VQADHNFYTYLHQIILVLGRTSDEPRLFVDINLAAHDIESLMRFFGDPVTAELDTQFSVLCQPRIHFLRKMESTNSFFAENREYLDPKCEGGGKELSETVMSTKNDT